MSFFLPDQPTCWSLKRTVLDHKNQTRLKGTGEGRLVPCAPDRWQWKEQWSMLWPDGQMRSAAQEHVWRLEGGYLQVFFPDQRPFVVIDLEQPQRTLKHRCGEDVYEGIWSWIGSDHWISTWHVRGPRKHQLIQTMSQHDSFCF